MEPVGQVDLHSTVENKRETPLLSIFRNGKARGANAHTKVRNKHALPRFQVATKLKIIETERSRFTHIKLIGSIAERCVLARVAEIDQAVFMYAIASNAAKPKC